MENDIMSYEDKMKKSGKSKKLNDKELMKLYLRSGKTKYLHQMSATSLEKAYEKHLIG